MPSTNSDPKRAVLSVSPLWDCQHNSGLKIDPIHHGQLELSFTTHSVVISLAIYHAFLSSQSKQEGHQATDNIDCYLWLFVLTNNPSNTTWRHQICQNETLVMNSQCGIAQVFFSPRAIAVNDIRGSGGGQLGHQISCRSDLWTLYAVKRHHNKKNA